MNEMMQAIIITLSDGRKGMFTGPVLVKPGDEALLKIASIQFVPPQPLPEGCKFEEIAAPLTASALGDGPSATAQG